MGNRSDSEAFLKDGAANGFLGGQDAGRPASDLSRDQFALGLNLTCRNGIVNPRPGYLKRIITFAAGIEDAFQSLNFQTGLFYSDVDHPSLVSSHGGRQFKVDIHAMSVSEITPMAAFSTTITVAGFIIPAVGNSVSPNVADATRMTLQQPIITIAGYTFTLTAINSDTNITIENTIAAQAAVVVPNGAAVSFTGLDFNSPNKLLNWSTQAENYWILQDNQSYPVIFDGSNTFRSNPAKSQVPVGNVMGYAAGRITVALPDRETYRAGDLIFGSSGTAINNGRDAILYFTENNYLNEGGDFAARVFGAPSDSGPILAMKAVAQSDQQLGQGPLLIGCPNVVFTVNLPYDRTIWKNLANALQSVIPIVGPVADSFVLVNTDAWYRSLDGIRSFIMAQRQFNSGPGNTPLSNEISDLIDQDSDVWLEWESAVLFDNRELRTTSPQMTPNGVFWRGLAVLDFTLTSSMRQRSSPAWEGVWTGLRILKIVEGKVNQASRCFMWVLNDESQIEIWELTKDAKTDNDGETSTPITWEIDLPSYDFNNKDQFKRLEVSRLIWTGVSGTVSMSLDWRSDESPCWYHWGDYTMCANTSDCGPFACTGPVLYSEQSRWPVRFPTPPDIMDAITKRRARTGYAFQPRLQVTGWAELRQFRLYAKDEPELLGIESSSRVENCTGAACGCDSPIFTISNPTVTFPAPENSIWVFSIPASTELMANAMAVAAPPGVGFYRLRWRLDTDPDWTDGGVSAVGTPIIITIPNTPGLTYDGEIAWCNAAGKIESPWSAMKQYDSI